MLSWRIWRDGLYFAVAEIDHWAPSDVVEALRQELSRNGANAELELYPGVEHGFAFPSRDAYDRNAAERHWERLHPLFRRTLSSSAFCNSVWDRHPSFDQPAAAEAFRRREERFGAESRE